jgi:hypothetical protein
MHIHPPLILLLLCAPVDQERSSMSTRSWYTMSDLHKLSYVSTTSWFRPLRCKNWEILWFPDRCPGRRRQHQESTERSTFRDKLHPSSQFSYNSSAEFWGHVHTPVYPEACFSVPPHPQWLLWHWLAWSLSAWAVSPLSLLW